MSQSGQIFSHSWFRTLSGSVDGTPLPPVQMLPLISVTAVLAGDIWVFPASDSISLSNTESMPSFCCCKAFSSWVFNSFLAIASNADIFLSAPKSITNRVVMGDLTTRSRIWMLKWPKICYGSPKRMFWLVLCRDRFLAGLDKSRLGLKNQDGSRRDSRQRKT